jgi:hypothetical protein
LFLFLNVSKLFLFLLLFLGIGFSIGIEKMKETGSSDSSVFGCLWSVSFVNALDQIGAVRDAIATGNVSTFDRTLGKFGDRL